MCIFRFSVVSAFVPGRGIPRLSSSSSNLWVWLLLLHFFDGIVCMHLIMLHIIFLESLTVTIGLCLEGGSSLYICRRAQSNSSRQCRFPQIQFWWVKPVCCLVVKRQQCALFPNGIDTAHVVCGRFCVMDSMNVVRPSVWSICRSLQQRVGGLLLWATRASNNNRFLHSTAAAGAATFWSISAAVWWVAARR